MCLGQLKKSLAISVQVLGLICLEAISYQTPALSNLKHPIGSQTDNLVCYMQVETGVILNLENLCRSEKRVQPLSEQDQKFIDDYKKLLSSYPQSQTILSIAEQNPETVLRKALQVCNELKTGRISPERVTQPEIDADILSSIATEYYCPEFND